MDWYSALARFCAYRERCTQEVCEKLQSIKAPEEEWEGVLAQLRAENFLNDQRYACSFARGKFRINQWGRIRIKTELRNSGISPAMIEKAMDEIGEEEYRDTTVKLVGRKMIELSKEDPRRRREKTFRYLLQKGYESAYLLEVLRIITEDTG